MVRSLSLAFALVAVAGCNANTTAPPPAAKTTPEPAPPPPAPASAGQAPSACPPPKQSSDVCAAVMVYVKNPANGTCCAYGSPCAVPIAGQRYGDDKCSNPM